VKPRAFPWVALVILGLGAPFLKAGSTAIFTDQAQSTGNTFTTAASFPIALVQKNYGAAYLTTSVSATFDATPVANHLLVAILGASTTSTINQPAGWSTAINQSGGSCTQPCQAIFYRIAGSGESRTVTVTVSDSNSVLGLQIYEYSGIDTSSPLDQTSSATGTSTSPSSGSVTTTQANELLIAGMIIRTETSYSGWTNSFNEQFDFQFEVGQTYVRTYAGADRVVTATGTYSTTATTAASGAWRGQIATFKNSGDYGGAHRAAPATSTPTPSTTPTPTPTGTPSPIATPTFTVIPSPTATPTATPAAMPSPTATPAPTPAITPTTFSYPFAVPTPTPFSYPFAVPTPTPAAKATPTAPLAATPTPAASCTDMSTPTVTPTPTATPTPS